jgi:hypothetical protein
MLVNLWARNNSTKIFVSQNFGMKSWAQTKHTLDMEGEQIMCLSIYFSGLLKVLFDQELVQVDENYLIKKLISLENIFQYQTNSISKGVPQNLFKICAHLFGLGDASLAVWAASAPAPNGIPPNNVIGPEFSHLSYFIAFFSNLNAQINNLRIYV